MDEGYSSNYSAISFFIYLRNIFLFYHSDPAKPCPLEKLIPLLHSAITTWFISNHSIFSHSLGDNISCSRLILYLQPLQPLSPIVFAPISLPSYPNSVSWLSPTSNTPHFHYFTTTNIINLSPSDSTDVPFYQPLFKGFVQENPDIIPSISNSIIDLLHPVPEPPYNICCDIFDGWFGIPFKDTSCFTHIRSPHPTEILSLYGLPNLINLYPSHLSANQIRTLVLHALPVTISNHITLYHPRSLRLLASNALVIVLLCSQCLIKATGTTRTSRISKQNWFLITCL